MDKPDRLHPSVCSALEWVTTCEREARQSPRQERICPAATLRFQANRETIGR